MKRDAASLLYVEVENLAGSQEWVKNRHATWMRVAAWLAALEAVDEHYHHSEMCCLFYYASSALQN